MAATYYPRRTSDAAGAVLVCLPGGTYSREYWDLNVPGRGGYSFAEFATERGYSVVTVDPLGTGESSKPVSDFDFADIAATLAVAVRELPAATGERLPPWPSRIRWVGIWRSPNKRCIPATPGWRSSGAPINMSHR